MGKSDKIEAFILELLKQEESEWLKIQRNEMAQILGCVPSQINYVIETRFSPERGYVVQTRRGGGGYVLIRRANTSEIKKESLTFSEARSLINSLCSRGVLTSREGRIIISVAEIVNCDRDRAMLVNKALEAVI